MEFLHRLQKSPGQIRQGMNYGNFFFFYINSIYINNDIINLFINNSNSKAFQTFNLAVLLLNKFNQRYTKVYD